LVLSIWGLCLQSDPGSLFSTWLHKFSQSHIQYFTEFRIRGMILFGSPGHGMLFFSILQACCVKLWLQPARVRGFIA